MSETERTLVLQSHRWPALRGWIGSCVDSARAWAEASGFEYTFLGDEFLEVVPPDLRAKIGPKLPIAADLARLYAAREALQSYERFVWLDADVLVFAPERLSVDIADSCAFGREIWVASDRKGKLKAWRNVHNAVMVFRAGDPVLPFLIRSTERILEDVDPARIAPQIVGPKMLSALHNIARFSLIDSVGAFSTEVIDDLAAGRGPALHWQIERSPVPPAAANLCASLAGEAPDDDRMERAVDFLLTNRGLQRWSAANAEAS